MHFSLEMEKRKKTYRFFPEYLYLYNITKHYLLTAPSNYGDFCWKDNPLIRVT